MGLACADTIQRDKIYRQETSRRDPQGHLSYRFFHFELNCVNCIVEALLRDILLKSVILGFSLLVF